MTDPVLTGRADIAWLLSVAHIANAADQTLPLLRTVRVVSDGTTVWATATDRYLLATASVRPDDAPPVLDVLIPGPWALKAAKMCAKKARVSPDVALGIEPGWGADLQHGDDTLHTACDAEQVEGYPETQRLLTVDKYPRHQWSMAPAKLRLALDVFATADAAGIPHWTTTSAVENPDSSTHSDHLGTLLDATRLLAVRVVGYRAPTPNTDSILAALAYPTGGAA